MLHEFIQQNRTELIERACAKARGRQPKEAGPELESAIADFLGQLAERLKPPRAADDPMRRSARIRPSERVRVGLTVRQVVHDYGDICQAITEVANEHDLPISTLEFRNLNQCLDDAIADAVTEFSHEREKSLVAGETERLGELAHELRKYVTTATLAYESIAKGTVGIGGSTGAILGRSLLGLRRLIDRTLAGVRLDHGEFTRRRLVLGEVIEEVEVAGSLEAMSSGIRLDVVRPALAVEVVMDRAVLAAAINNIVSNALKFTPRGGTVVLRTILAGDSVAIEVEDQCGGLTTGSLEDILRPLAQHGEDHGGLALGLGISRKGIEAGGGKLSVRDVPLKGCVFAITLPKAPLLS